MNLVIDWGNSSLKAAWFEPGKQPEIHRGLTALELGALIDIKPADAVLVSSTSHPGDSLRAELAIPEDIFFLTLTGTTPVPIEKRYDTPHTLGADRVAAAVGAKVLFPEEACLVIDMGTCITYDYVDEAAVFQGGMISPGLRMRFLAMHTFTERLPLVEPEEPNPPLLARSTRQAMQAGVINGLLAEVNGIMETHRSANPAVKVLLCGGDAPFFEESLKAPTFSVPELVLLGLNRILEHNLSGRPTTVG